MSYNQSSVAIQSKYFIYLMQKQGKKVSGTNQLPMAENIHNIKKKHMKIKWETLLCKTSDANKKLE